MVEAPIPAANIVTKEKRPPKILAKVSKEKPTTRQLSGNEKQQYDNYRMHAQQFAREHDVMSKLGFSQTSQSSAQQELFDTIFAFNLALKETPDKSGEQVNSALTEDIGRAIQQYPMINTSKITRLFHLKSEARMAQREQEIATIAGVARELAGVYKNSGGNKEVIVSELADIQNTIREDPSWYQEERPYSKIEITQWKPDQSEKPTEAGKYPSWENIKGQIMQVEQIAFGDHAFSEEELQKMFNRSDAVVTLVKDRNKIVGYSVTNSTHYEYEGNTAELSDNDTNGKTSAYVESIGLLPRYQGKVLGERMMRGIEATLRDQGYLYMELHTSNPGLMRMIDRTDRGRIIEGGEPMEEKILVDRGGGQGEQVKYRISLYETDPKILAQAEAFIRKYDIKNQFGFSQRQLEIFKLGYALSFNNALGNPGFRTQIDMQIDKSKRHEEKISMSPIEQHYASDNSAWIASMRFTSITPVDMQNSADQDRYDREVNQIIEETAHPKPKLENIQQVRAALTNDENLPEGQKPEWQRLTIPEKSNGETYSLLELNNTVRETVREYIEKRLPQLRDIPSFEAFQNIPDADLLNALTHGWFDPESVSNVVDGEQNRLLLATAEHMVSRIENGVYQRFLTSASQDQLHAMGLTTELRDVMLNTLKVSSRANPLFIRFMGYVMPESTNSPLAEEGREGDESEAYTGTALFMPEGKGPYDLATLFPKESASLARGFDRIIAESSAWQNTPGADAFIKHLQALSDLHKSNVDGSLPSIKDRQDAVRESYNALLDSGFPIIVTPQMDPGEKPPYIDPEIKVSLRLPKDSAEEQRIGIVKDQMAQTLPELGADVANFADDLRSLTVHRVVTIGAFGSDLVLRSVAQEEGSIILYIDEQERAYGQELAGKIGQYIDTQGIINLSHPDTQALLSNFSMLETSMHESDHAIYSRESDESQRMGADAPVILDEVKADTLYRALIPHMLDLEVAQGKITVEEAALQKKQWAITTTGTMMQSLEQGVESNYYKANIQLLNALLSPQGTTPPALELHEGKLRITNFDAFYDTMYSQATDILTLYRKTPEKANEWIAANCQASDRSKEVLNALGLGLTNEAEE